MTTEEAAAIAAWIEASKKATPGPWFTLPSYRSTSVFSSNGGDRITIARNGAVPKGSVENAEFIALSRSMPEAVVAMTMWAREIMKYRANDIERPECAWDEAIFEFLAATAPIVGEES